MLHVWHILSYLGAERQKHELISSLIDSQESCRCRCPARRAHLIFLSWSSGLPPFFASARRALRAWHRGACGIERRQRADRITQTCSTIRGSKKGGVQELVEKAY
jgi:hypothetical protein